MNRRIMVEKRSSLVTDKYSSTAQLHRVQINGRFNFQRNAKSQKGINSFNASIAYSLYYTSTNSKRSGKSSRSIDLRKLNWLFWFWAKDLEEVHGSHDRTSCQKLCTYIIHNIIVTKIIQSRRQQVKPKKERWLVDRASKKKGRRYSERGQTAVQRNLEPQDSHEYDKANRSVR